MDVERASRQSTEFLDDVGVDQHAARTQLEATESRDHTTTTHRAGECLGERRKRSEQAKARLLRRVPRARLFPVPLPPTLPSFAQRCQERGNRQYEDADP